MKVIVARTAGFCKGVKDAIEVTLEAIQKREDGEKICTFGPLIHNRQVLAMLEEKGIREENRIQNCAGKKVVIRAHGIPPHERQALHGLGAELLDATCKRVARVHAAIKRHARRGFHTVIVGDEDHAEVIGLMGYTEGRGVVINRPEQVEELPPVLERVLLVAQTTQNEEVFQEIRDRFLKRYPRGVVKNTICDSTQERQTEVRRICSLVEAMVIVGGSHSGNTMRLAEVARECSVPTYHVETEADLDRLELAHYSCVGVSAGASTPNWIIWNVVRFLESIQPKHAGVQFKVKRFMEQLSYANIYVALAAACLPPIAEALAGFRCTFSDSVVAACYAFAMHSLNIYLDRDAIRLNDPSRAAFYQRWRPAFTGMGILAMAVSLWLAFKTGILVFLVMAALVVLGLLYTVPLIVPASLQMLNLKIKDIPTSKTFSVPVAWTCASVLVPRLSEGNGHFGAAIYAFWTVFLLVLIRTILLDLLAVQGDRLGGKETLVVSVGETKTVRFAVGILLLFVCSLVAGPATGLSGTFAPLLLPAAIIYSWHLGVCVRKHFKESPTFEASIEFVLIGSGFLALLWNSISAG